MEKGQQEKGLIINQKSLVIKRNIRTREETVFADLDKKGRARYKGILVLRVPIKGAAISFGAILIGKEFRADEDGVNMLRHEYGHIVQLKKLGFLNFLLKIAIPSFKNYRIAMKDHEVWLKYYDYPWEYMADVFGGVKRVHSEIAEIEGQRFWDDCMNRRFFGWDK